MYGKDGKNMNFNLISLKYELFDHLIYPISIKLDDNSIIQLFRKLHIMSSIDYKISYEEWVEQAISNLAGFTGNNLIFDFNFQNREGSSCFVYHF